MRRLFALLGLFAAVACAPALASPPRPFGVPTAITGDTVRVTAAPCDIDEPGVACAVTLTGTAGANAITFGAVPNVAKGGSIAVAASFTCSTPGQAVGISVTVSSRALNRSGNAGPATLSTGTANYTCADALPGAPRNYTVTIVVSGG